MKAKFDVLMSVTSKTCTRDKFFSLNFSLVKMVVAIKFHNMIRKLQDFES